MYGQTDIIAGNKRRQKQDENQDERDQKKIFFGNVKYFHASFFPKIPLGLNTNIATITMIGIKALKIGLIK